MTAAEQRKRKRGDKSLYDELPEIERRIEELSGRVRGEKGEEPEKESDDRVRRPFPSVRRGEERKRLLVISLSTSVQSS